MLFDFETRPSDSPLVETIWAAHNEQVGAFTSLATSHWEMVVTRHEGNLTLTVRGPETRNPRKRFFAIEHTKSPHIIRCEAILCLLGRDMHSGTGERSLPDVSTRAVSE